MIFMDLRIPYEMQGFSSCLHLRLDNVLMGANLLIIVLILL